MTEIQLKNRGPIAELVLDGPESRNALDADNLRDIAAAVAKVAEAVPNVRVLLIRGEGKVFCSGRDIANVDVETDDATPSSPRSSPPSSRRSGRCRSP